MNDNKFETDKDIVAYVKDLFSQNRIASSLILFFSLNETGLNGEFVPPKVFKYAGNNVDDMVVKLFDMSLTSKICSVFPSMDWNGQCGALDLTVVPSTDGQTNITSNLIEFFKCLTDPYFVEKLKEPFRPQEEIVRDWKIGDYLSPFDFPILSPLSPFNPWMMFEDDEWQER